MAAFTPGDLVVYRVGTGAAALSGVATAVFLDEYTPTGTFVQSIALPTADAGANQTLTASGSATSEGLLTTSADGRYLLLTGYDAALGTAGVAATASAATARIVGRVDGAGAVDTTTALTNFSTGNNIRSAASPDGTNLYVTGGATGIAFTTLGATTATQLSTSPTNIRQVELFGDQLYVSSGSGATRVATVGTGEPTTGGQTIANLPGTPSTGSPYAFALVDLSSAVAGNDTLYVADDSGTGGGILKYTLTGGSWVADGAIAGSYRGLTASVSGGQVTLYATSGSTLVKAVDASGYDGTLSGTAATLATAATNTAFRGVAFAPVSAVADMTPPTLVTPTSPADEATGVATGANIVLTFNEAVKAGSGAITVTDNAGDTRTISAADATQVSVGSDGKTVTINPTADLLPAHAYHVTVASGAITDAAGNAYAGLAAGALDFTTDSTVTPPSLSITALDATKPEGAAGATTAFTFTVTRANDVSGATSAHYDVAGSGANPADAADFIGGALPSGDVAFAAFETSKTITVNVAGDATIETAETFSVTLSSPTNGATLGTASATGTIQTDDIAFTPIYTIQGSGASSTLTGQSVTTQGVVTAVDTNGFYIQDAAGDGDAATSDGIFVFTSSRPSVTVGSLVSVAGQVQEFVASGAVAGTLPVTEIGAVTGIATLSVSAALPAPVVIGGTGGLKPPTSDLAAGNAFFESLEGMLVKVVAPQATGPTNQFGEIFTVASNGADASGVNGRGDILISGGATSFGNTDTAGGDFNPERIQIDPGLGRSTPQVSVGARLADVTGIVNYSFGNYEVLATSPVTVAAPSPLAKTGATLTGDSSHVLIASYNAENLDPGDGAARFAIVGGEIVTKLNAPDILALQEVQDNNGAAGGTGSAVTSASQTLQMIVDAVNAAGGPQYAFIDNPFIGANTNGGEPGGNIRTAYLYRTDHVSLVPGSLRTIGADGRVIADQGSATADAAANSDQQTNIQNPFYGSRPPLAADFLFNGQVVTVVNNHFTSKGGSGVLAGSAQPPFDAGEVSRAAQAQAVNTFVDGLLGANPNARIIVTGDLNDYGFEQPLSVLRGVATVSNYNVPGSDAINATATYTPGGAQVLSDLQDLLPADQRFDYVFEGNAQTLDHMLASASLAAGAQFQPVHINSEFFDQTSDHDPLIGRFSVTSALTTQQTVSGAASFTLPTGGSLAVATGPAILWNLGPATTGANATIDNAGAIAAAAGRAIDTAGTANGANRLTVINRSGASVTASSDVLRVSSTNAPNGFPGAVIAIDNTGSLTSTGDGYAIDLTPVTSATASVAIANTAGSAAGDGTIRASASHDAIRLGGGGTTAITNSGTIDATAGAFRAINALDYRNVAALTITNLAGGIIQSQDDAVRITTANAAAVGTGTVSLDNSGAIRSTGSGQAVDFNDVNAAAGKVTIANRASGVIIAANNDGLRPGQNASVTNAGQITGNAAAAPTSQPSSDGVDFQDSHVGTLRNTATGVISGARHGVNGGTGVDITVVNEAGGRITGRDGSGVGLDGTGRVTNSGTITGTIDATSLRGDGDGVDIDLSATIVNSGVIQGLGAKGNDSGGRANAGEGISIGGGSIENHGLIRASSTSLDGAQTNTAGGAIVVNNDGNADRSGVAATTITNFADGRIIGESAYAIRLENKGSEAIAADVVTNFGSIIGNGAIPDPAATVTYVNAQGSAAADPNSVGTLDGITYAGTGSARFIRGDGAAIQTGEGADILNNHGAITGNNGRAISLEGGDDTLNLFAGETISGRIDGGAGADLITLSSEGALTTGALANVVNVERLSVQSGAWSLGDAQAYSGGVAVASGATLRIGDGALTGNVADAGALVFASSGAAAYAGAISGAGGVTQSGAGSLRLTGASSYAGGTSLAAGALDLGAAGAAGTGAITFGDGAQTLFLDRAALVADGAGARFANTLTGFGLGDVIDLRGVGTATTATLANGALTLTGGSIPVTLQVGGPAPAGYGYGLAADGSGGTRVALDAIATVTGVSASPATATLGLGAAATLTLALSEAVSVAGGAPTLRLSDGGVATYSAAASDATHLAFTHTVAAGQSAADLAITGLDLNGASVVDSGRVAANLAGAAANPAGTLAVDTTAPSATLSALDPTSTAAASVRYAVTLSEAVTGLDAADFRIATTGGLTGAAVTGLTMIDATHYAVAVSTGSGAGGLALTLAAAGSGIADIAGNPLAADAVGPAYAASHNQPPAAAADSARVKLFGAAVTGSVLANDADADGDALTVTGLRYDTGPARDVPAGGAVTLDGTHGALTLSADGAYSYKGEHPGLDVFTYTASDGHGGFAQASLTIGVGDEAPAASAAFAFKFTDAKLAFVDGHDLLTAPGGAVTDVTGIGALTFSDGAIQEKDGAPLVDDLYYYAKNLDVWSAHVDPDLHYAQYGWREGRDPNAYFSTNAYLSANPDVAAAGIDPLAHYDQYGWKEGRSPSADFSAEAYLGLYTDVAAAKIDPLAHYLGYGEAEGRFVFPGQTQGRFYGDFDAAFYLQTNADVAAAVTKGVNAQSFAFNHYLTYGAAEGRDPNAVFSTKGYLSANPDVAANGSNPLLHYETYGWHEGRDAGPAFHTNAYLAQNGDVAAAQIDPLGHYLQYGAGEGRHAV